MISFIIGCIVGCVSYIFFKRKRPVKIKKRKYDKHLHLGGLLDD